MKVAQSYLTLCDPEDYTVHGILQIRIVVWVAFPFSRGSSQPRNQTGISCIAGGFLETPQIKSITTFVFSPCICHEVMDPDARIFVFVILSFKPAFSLYSFTFIKRLFSSSLLSAIRVVSSAYLRLLIFFLAILIPAYNSSHPAKECSDYQTFYYVRVIQPSQSRYHH